MSTNKLDKLFEKAIKEMGGRPARKTTFASNIPTTRAARGTKREATSVDEFETLGNDNGSQRPINNDFQIGGQGA